MSKLMTALLAWLIFTIPAALAQKDQPPQDEHAAHHPPAAQSADREQPDPAWHLRANLKAMRDMMARLRNTDDPAERKRLLGAHMQAMQEQLQIMRSAAAPHDHDADGQMAGEKSDAANKQRGMMKGGMMRAGMMKMHEKVELRLDALQGLLEQLIEHEAAEDAPSSH